jgi:hypothetical protein
MCMSCGCGKPDDDHGDSRNITMNDLNEAAAATGISPTQVVQNIRNIWQQVSEHKADTSVRQSNYGQTQGFLQPGS